MSKNVLESSAILAIIFQERAAENQTEEVMATSIMSTVNFAEVQAKLIQKGLPPEEAWEDASSLVAELRLFTTEQARTAGSLNASSEKYGLFLGDRACLAVAISLNAPVYTTEQIWRDLNLGIPILVIR